MGDPTNKMQIRATVFSSINSILSSPLNEQNAVIHAEVDKLKEIQDKDFLSKLLIKELISTKDEDRVSLISLILLNCVPLEILENNIWTNLSLKTVSDEKKYQLVEILKSMGKFIEYDKYLDYFEEPQKIIDLDTNKILSSAMLNPEAQIDFLDFMETLTSGDKLLLIQSMVEDYTKDDLANIISPVIMYEKDPEIIEYVIKELVKTKSEIAYYPLKNFSERSKDEALVRLATKGLKELQLAGINEKSAKEFYSKCFNNSILNKCYTSIPDGKGNQGLIFTRIRTDNQLQIFCVVINDTDGVSDCFGFSSISQLELSLILKKFATYGELPFTITFETALGWLNEAEKISYNNIGFVPYEYACWKEILFDVEPPERDITETLNKALEILPKKEPDLEEIFKTPYLDKLFLTKTENPKFSALTDELDEFISKSDEINLNEIEKVIKKRQDEIFDEQLKAVFIARLKKIAFILMSNSKLKIASQIYALSIADAENPQLQTFFLEAVKKSIFVYYEQEFQRKYLDTTDNIFLRKAKNSGTKIDNEKLKNLLTKILEEWGQDE